MQYDFYRQHGTYVAKETYTVLSVLLYFFPKCFLKQFYSEAKECVSFYMHSDTKFSIIRYLMGQDLE